MPFSSVDVEAGRHGKFSELVQDVGMSILRSLLLVHSKEGKNKALEVNYKDAVQDAEKYQHKASASMKSLKDIQ